MCTRLTGLIAALPVFLVLFQESTGQQQLGPPEESYRLRMRSGVVRAIDRDSITVELFEMKEQAVRPGPDGKPLVVWENLIPAVPAKPYKFMPLLAEGKTANRFGAEYGYRPADVRAGDVVYVVYSRIAGVDYCDHIAIRRRPGGKVPPSPLDKPDDPRAWHVRMNAEQEAEEARIAPPREVKPPGPAIAP
jgi:hypothetical protein